MRITLVLTHQCNLACTYCYAGEKFNRAMPDAVAARALEMAFQDHSGFPVMVSFFGGEPMLEYRRMVRYSRLARRLGARHGREVKFQVTTNVTILTDRIIEFLSDYRFQVGLSVDGLGETQDRHRPFVSGRASSPLVWHNLERAAGKVKDASVLMVVNPDTLGGVPASVERLRQLGYRKASLLPHMEALWDGAARQHAEQVYTQLARWTRQTLNSDRPLWLSPFADQFYPGGLSGACGFGEDDLAVAPSGNLYPCARLVGPDTRADIRLGSVAEGLSQDALRRVRAKARAKMEGCGAQGCQCAALMPGKTLTQLDNSGFFLDLIRRAAGQAALAEVG